MKNLAVLLLAAAAVGAATVIVSVALQRVRDPGDLEQVPELIEDCFDRLHQLERELHRLRPDAKPA
jgi:hypothetical protein